MARVPKLCSCGRVVQGKCPSCSTAKRAMVADYELTPTERSYDKQWQRLSLRFRQQYPLCQACEAEGRTRAAREVHHKIPIKERFDLRMEWSNLMSVCRPCHVKLDRTEWQAL